MNITELESYNLADAVKFHDRLNPRLWGEDEHLRGDVRDKLLEIAEDFKEFLGVDNLQVKDITVSGSNAAYSYTPHSDIDLHLVVDLPEADSNEVFRELFDAKKFQYNKTHDIRIGGYDVELYVQNPAEEHHSQGIYSLLQNQWISVPKRRQPDINDISVKSKYEDVGHRIEDAVRSGSMEQMNDTWQKLKAMRKQGLEREGEFSPENLAFKILRTNGTIQKLVDARQAVKDRELSLQESKRKKKKTRVRYGFGGYWYPGFSYGGEGSEGAGDGGGGGESIDGVNPSTKQILETKTDDVVMAFIKDTAARLGIQRMPKIQLHSDPEWSEREKSFGMFVPDKHELHVNTANRHLFDILRTTAHELAHVRQHEIQELDDTAGNTGSPVENEAHAVAGIIMRDFADAHPEWFADQPITEGILNRAAAAAAIAAAMSASAQTAEPQPQTTSVQQVLQSAMKLYGLSKLTQAGAKEEFTQEFKNYIRAQGGDANAQNQSRIWQQQQRQPQNESASGYIPTKKQAKDPRFSHALTVDIKPGQVGKEANKLALQTNSQGAPALLIKDLKNALREFKESGSMPQPSQGPGKYKDLNEPLGPETPPTMPAGTLRVDVSDVYDWYKLGQHISNMKGLGKHDFGAGPPSSIISFGDEETEHKFIKDLEATGLDVTDIDPKDPKQPAGMRKIKTDPTYNVDEDAVQSLRREFSLLEDEYIPEVRMSTSNLRQLAAKTGARAGMEFEMIVPDVGGVDLEPEYERDDDQDRRARSFDDIEEFFYDGDYNSRGDVRSLLNELGEAYMEWKMDRTASDWDDEGLDYLRDYIENYDLFDRDEALEIARDEFADANPDIPLDSEEAQRGISARVAELEEQFVQDEFESQGRIYNDAFTEFADEKNQDYEESDFLEEAFPYMSDIERNFDIQWPYYYDINDGQDGEANVDEVADEFSDAIGKPVNASSSYHGARREPGHYVVEPDGSLEGDEPGDTGLEFVSPPLPIDELLSDLNKVKEWAGRRGCYTNDSTGLHINISVPDYSLEKLDYVKLALLMGDEYVLELFGRSGNSYAKAATGKIRDALRKNPDLAPALLDKMRDHMEDLATKAIHSGITDKYTSINTKTGYIEFRSPGGDWLDANFDKIENTLLRFTVALSAAIDPQAYRKEYLKKLYKLLEGSQEKGGVDVVQLFSNYSAGELDKAALIRQVREKQLARDLAKGRTPPGQKFWWKVTNPANTMASIEVVAAGPEEAKAKAVEPGNYPEWARVQNTLRATPLRPYQEPEKKPEQTGNWGIWIRSANRFARAPGQADNSVLRRFPGRDSALQWIEQTRRERPDLRTDIEVREIEPTRQSGTPLSQTDAERRMDLPDQTGDANWEIVDRRTGRRVFVMIANTEYDARRKYADWLSAAGYPIETEDYGFREIARPGSTLDLQRQRANATQDNWSQDFERRMQQPAQQPATGGEFTGQWQVMFNGQELTRVSGIGNNQADANRFARDYVLQQIRSGQLRPVEGAEIEVIPVMA